MKYRVLLSRSARKQLERFSGEMENRILKLTSASVIFLMFMLVSTSKVFAQGAPTTVSHIDGFGGTQTLGVAVAGRYAYFANQYGGLRAYDISDPSHPVNICNTNDDGLAWAIVLSGNYAYLANGEDGLRIYDISNPTNIVGVGHAVENIPFVETRGVVVSGNYAFVANSNDGLRIYDISNPTNPVSVGHASAGIWAQAVAISGNYVYLANDADGLRIYDVSSPTNPVSVGQIYDGGSAEGVTISSNFLYLANSTDGMRIYDISNPTNPANIGQVYTNSPGWNIGGANRISVSGNYAYVANLFNGLRIYDVSNPTQPINVGWASHQYNSATDVIVANGYAYLADAENGFWIYSLSPQLKISQTTANMISLSWFTYASPDNFQIQQKTDLASTNWTTLTNAPLVVNGQKQLLFQLSAEKTFFRLKEADESN